MGSAQVGSLVAVGAILLAMAVPAVAEPAERSGEAGSDASGSITLSEADPDDTAALSGFTVASFDQLEPVPVDDPLVDLQWYLRAIRAQQAWRISTGAPEITVAVIDTGINPTHRDLDGAFWTDPVTGSFGRDYVGGSVMPYGSLADDWHGTAIAGVIAARANDGYGMAGVAPDVTVMSMRIYTSPSTDESPVLEGGYGTAINAIDDAARLGADVILLAWGGQDPSLALRNAIADAGVPVVVAAGNDGSDLSDANADVLRYPARYRLPNMITVTASNLDDQLWFAGDGVAANIGARHVDIAAPGELVLGPFATAGREHRYNSGTSFAAPQVAAALALARSVAPSAGPAELIGELNRTARPASAFADTVTSGGILDVAAFLSAVQRPVCTDDLPPAGYLDVNADSVHAPGIDCITAFDLARGVGEDRFAPAASVTRGQMATFLTRLLVRAGAVDAPAEAPDSGGGADGSDGTGDGNDDGTDDGEVAASFTDTAGTTHAAAIEVVSELGIARGFDDGTFRPNTPVTRGQMASFIVRTVEELTGETYGSERNWFDDIQGTTHEQSILAARELAITLGSGTPRLYQPDTTLTRAQLASLLARSLDALAREGVVLEPPA